MIGKIDIEIIDNNIESETGMMYRNNIGHHQGMLFIFKECSERSFWMKNTEVALDIIFADSSKKINKIYSDATPLSEEFLPSLKPVKYTIEVKAGYCSGMGISEGDLISYSIKMPGITTNLFQ